MAIRVSGTIVISRKSGKRGAFNIGDLRTEIGNFEVKDALIEEFDEGSYTGDFFIKWIEPQSIAWQGRVFVKVRAELDEIVIDDVDTTPEPSSVLPPDADPVDEAAALFKQDAPTPAGPAPAISRASATGGLKQRSPAKPTPVPASALNTEADDRELFGDELFELLLNRSPIKLDPTVDRMLFRKQRDRLKDLHYAFDAKRDQTWMPPVD